MKILIKSLVIITAFGLMLSSCYKHNWEELHPIQANTPCTIDTGTVISYSANIVPIINAKCATSGACHAVGGSPDFTIYGDNSTGLYSECRHDTSGAPAWQDITGESGNMMPQQGSTQLTTCEKNAIRNWIHQGAINN